MKKIVFVAFIALLFVHKASANDLLPLPRWDEFGQIEMNRSEALNMMSKIKKDVSSVENAINQRFNIRIFCGYVRNDEYTGFCGVAQMPLSFSNQVINQIYELIDIIESNPNSTYHIYILSEQLYSLSQHVDWYLNQIHEIVGDGLKHDEWRDFTQDRMQFVRNEESLLLVDNVVLRKHIRAVLFELN